MGLPVVRGQGLKSCSAGPKVELRVCIKLAGGLRLPGEKHFSQVNLECIARSF